MTKVVTMKPTDGMEILTNIREELKKEIFQFRNDYHKQGKTPEHAVMFTHDLSMQTIHCIITEESIDTVKAFFKERKGLTNITICKIQLIEEIK